MNYELLVSAVSDRGDLFVESMESLIACVDAAPSRILVHEDVRNERHPHIESWLKSQEIPYKHQLRSPAGGMGPAVQWLLEHATTELVLYTQEDWLVLRALPVARTMELMLKHGLHHIRWNKRKTMRAKHEDKPHMRWDKVEVEFDGQTLCISDHWYTQTSMWRRERILPAVQAVAQHNPQSEAFVARMNDWLNRKYGDGRPWNDQQMRHEKLGTYIWGGIGEPAFIKHTGSTRGTGKIVDHLGA